MASLHEFFEAVVPYLRGESTVDAFVARAGASPSGRARTELYPWLVRGDLERIIDDLFPAFRVGCDLARPGLYASLRRRYLERHPPRHFELYRWGETFADFVGEVARADLLPGYLEEIADFHFTRYRILTADVPAAEQRFESTLFVRQYAFETPAFVIAAERGLVSAALVGVAGAAPVGAAPLNSPRIYLHYRSLLDGSARFCVPTTAMLLAVTRFAQPGAAPAALVAAVTDADLRDAESSLLARGILP